MLHKLHRSSAIIIVAFFLIHFLNHLFALQGTAQHIAFMESVRPIYRNTVVEVFLMLCVAFQTGSGLYFAWSRKGQRRGFFEKAQVISGLYLAFFFLNHIGAVLYGRLVLELDTNIYYGIAGFHVSPFQFFFIPYYFLAVVAVFVHLAAALHWLSRNRLSKPLRKWLSILVIFVGVMLSNLLIDAFCGVFYDIDVPQVYRATFEQLSP